MLGNDNPADAELACDGGGVQRSSAAEGHQRVVARIAAALDRYRSDRFGDLVGGDPVYADRIFHMVISFFRDRNSRALLR